MDGLVIQIQGFKNWRVYDPVMTSFPRPDMVQRPFEFLKDPKTTVEEFRLNAGDVLYVPRGIVHEATTQNNTEPSNSQVSLHLTFGLETATHYSVEVS
jgi:ribosomal protein L16 Arg81 hydroxylase